MAHYVKLSIPKADAVAMLAMLRLAKYSMDREPTFEERRALESLEYAIEGKDRRKMNRAQTPRPTKGKRMGFLDVRRAS